MEGQWTKRARRKARAARRRQRKGIENFVKPDDWPTEIFSTKRKEEHE